MHSQHVPIPWEGDRLRSWCGRNCLASFSKHLHESLEMHLSLKSSKTCESQCLPGQKLNKCLMWFSIMQQICSEVFSCHYTKWWLVFPRHSVQLYISLALQAQWTFLLVLSILGKTAQITLDHCTVQLISLSKFDAHFNIKLQEWRGHRLKRPV